MHPVSPTPSCSLTDCPYEATIPGPANRFQRLAFCSPYHADYYETLPDCPENCHRKVMLIFNERKPGETDPGPHPTRQLDRCKEHVGKPVMPRAEFLRTPDPRTMKVMRNSVRSKREPAGHLLPADQRGASSTLPADHHLPADQLRRGGEMRAPAGSDAPHAREVPSRQEVQEALHRREHTSFEGAAEAVRNHRLMAPVPLREEPTRSEVLAAMNPMNREPQRELPRGAAAPDAPLAARRLPSREETRRLMQSHPGRD